MLQIQHIYKEYKTGSLVQKALDDVSLNLRDNEFVAILGPSGSGKTTLLNIIGGLDRYDSGDLIINGISTKKYKDRDWDSYRNHTIGFVFQSYNLIPHQTVLANVELALTISGIGKAERKKRAVAALEQVGLGNQLHKKPSQMSGGQMQRVAIARALVNDPDILLADEPTGALDSDTSVQVMDLLKEVAKDRLVVMVTHNPELAEQYATRIVRLSDGKIRADSNPYEVDEAMLKEPEHKNMGKSSMSFLTALSLSFNNLKTKKARTLLTSFAGSIGIIGIALILSLSTGVNKYIKNVEEETLSEYPLQIQSTGFSLASMSLGMADSEKNTESDDGNAKTDKENSGDKVKVIKMVTNMFSTMASNDLEALKKYLDEGDSGIEQYTTAVEYTYNISPQIFKKNEDGIRQVNPDKSFDAVGLGSSSGSNSLMSSMMSTDVFYEMPENSKLYEKQYDIKKGRWPENYNECVVVLTSNGGISDFLLYTLGLRDPLELDEMIQQFASEENIETPSDFGTYTYKDLVGIQFKLVNSADYYTYDEEYQVWKDKSDNEDFMKQLVADGEELTIVGVVQPAEGSNAASLNAGIAYPKSLTKHVAEESAKSEIVKQQLANPSVNVFTNEAFGEVDKENGFDMQSLFTVDSEALEKAFSFDESALSGLENSMGDMGSADLSGEFSMDASSMGQSISAEEMQAIAGSLLEGYQQYAKDNPQADYSNLSQYFMNYLNTEEARKILSDNIKEIITANGMVTITPEQIQSLIQQIMGGYQQYVIDHGYTDPEKFDEYLAEYLQTEEAQGIITAWASEIFTGSGNIEITQEQMQKLSSELFAGYQTYAQNNGLPDPAKLGDSFAAYLNTADGQQRIAAGLSNVMNVDAVQQQMMTAIQQYMQQAMTQMGNKLQSAMASGMQVDEEAFLNAFQINMNEDELTELLMSMGSATGTTYENNLKKLGYVDFAVPSGINIYPKDFESKAHVVEILDAYNNRMEKEGRDEQVITYTDMVGTLMSSVTDIVDIITYVLIAFVAISLVVSSIMIGVITYISVLERRKEIGILRAIGASKRNVSQVFNAETFIIGLCAGLIGIGFTLLLIIPVNAIIHNLANTTDVSAVLPVVPALVLILLSILLTLLGGLIPSKKASKSDPVTALRTE